MVQPADKNRTSKASPAFRKLLASIDEFGILQMPVVSLRDGAYTIIDGHRRVAAALDLGWTELECRVVLGLTEKDETNLFAALSAVTRKLSASDHFQGWFQCLSVSDERAETHLKALPSSVSKNIRTLIRVMGLETAKRLAKDGRDPTPIGFVGQTVSILASLRLVDAENVEGCRAHIAHWLFATKAVSDVRAFNTNYTVTSGRALLKAVKDGTRVTFPKDKPRK